MKIIKLTLSIIDQLSKVSLLIAIVLVSGCITETRGGFNVNASPEKAFQDYLQLSTGYLQQNDFANTRRHLNNAAAINPDNSELYGIWALLNSQEGDLELADANFLRALQIDEGNSQVRNNYAAFLFSQSRFVDAFQELELVVADTNYNSRPQAYENMGLAALQLNNLDAADIAFNRALQLDSNQLRASLELVDINLIRGDVLQARQYYRNFLTLINFYNIEQSARSLWSGIKLEQALGNDSNVYAYGDVLDESYSNSPEYQLYQQLLNTQGLND